MAFTVDGRGSTRTPSRSTVKKSYNKPVVKPKGTSTLKKNTGTQQLSNRGTQRLEGYNTRAQNAAGWAKAVQSGDATQVARQAIRNTRVGKALSVKDGAKKIREDIQRGGYEGYLSATQGAKSLYDNAKAVGKGAGKVLETKVGKKATERLASSGAVQVGTKVATSAAGKIAAKGAARFVPGLNVAVAVHDAKVAYDTVRDPKASTWKKGTAVATAAGSALAATNIPGVSQVGAGISLASSVASEISPKAVAEGGKQLIRSLNPFD